MSLFHSFHHVCIVVRDLDRAQAYYEGLGVGPWQNFPSLEPFRHDLQVPNTEDFLKLKYRFAVLGSTQLQLCEPSEGDTLQWHFLQEKGEGVFHLGFSVPDCDSGEQEGKATGLGILMHGRKPDGSGFTYFDTAPNGAGVILEIRAGAKPPVK